ncbi:DNA-directed RNA polymerase subunit H [Halopenitus persicus]|uniref:DNA-directed RNA polymerase subunit Rpo5 n=1 Tax=Halopenitus persicus TaxID=1048396 RepID=A0A1H3FNR6_9EURY|nr:DNA-directed RNA polymerase subunit H [Halopenitus persicus]QHS16718.1 DNA-directed RNA polymerase subunit H [haloarchaeon 3A1-DGR]SDX92038.1 DNA-directed RNA polymerase subunit H [Halopenitus persicus]
MVNVTDHELVPDHELLDDPEAVEEVLAEYNVSKTDLPRIKRTDPALPDEAEPGDVVKIVRESRTTDQAIVYRLVIS